MLPGQIETARGGGGGSSLPGDIGMADLGEWQTFGAVRTGAVRKSRLSDFPEGMTVM